MQCHPKQIGDRWVCERCGYTHDIPFRKNCPMDRKWSEHRGLGDSLSAMFLMLGISPKPSCDCDWRRTLFNKVAPYEPKHYLRLLVTILTILLVPVLVPLCLPVVVYKWTTVVPETDADKVAKKRAVHEAARQRRSCPVHHG